jgi:hypothetical protein
VVLERPSYIYASALTRRELAGRRRRRQPSGPLSTAFVTALLAVSAVAAFVAHLFGA